mmetsp:Transcript_40590/g.100395  ORF Transcript_40590/g.100395 Transcript_40590/m.100395 type:complete len:105 (+) Transcript_40590:1082-1396(+)
MDSGGVPNALTDEGVPSVLTEDIHPGADDETTEGDAIEVGNYLDDTEEDEEDAGSAAFLASLARISEDQASARAHNDLTLDGICEKWQIPEGARDELRQMLGSG